MNCNSVGDHGTCIVYWVKCVGLYSSSSQHGASRKTALGAQGQRNAKTPQLPRTLQSFFRDVPSRLPESGSGAAHQHASAGNCAEPCPDSVRAVTAPAAGSDEVRFLLQKSKPLNPKPLPWTKMVHTTASSWASKAAGLQQVTPMRLSTA